MKQKDIALIVVIGIVSAAVSFLVSNKLFVTPDNRQQQVEVVDPINAVFQKPNSKYFNSSSIDPTRSSSVDAGGNQDIFNGSH